MEEQLSGSIDHSKVKTAGSRLDNFFRYLDKYNLRNEYLSNDMAVTDPLIARYVEFSLRDFTIKLVKIATNTINGYMDAINKHHWDEGYSAPYNKHVNTKAASIMEIQKKVKKGSNKREPLKDKMIVKMCKMSKTDPLGFYTATAVWDFVGLGRYSDNWCAEYMVDS